MMRTSLKAAILGLMFIAAGLTAAIAVESKLPDVTKFESGDFVWPKVPGARIRYRYGSKTDEKEEYERWEAEKNAFVARISGDKDPYALKLRQELKTLNFQQFRNRYFKGYGSGERVQYSGSDRIPVGHIGIVEIDPQGKPWVIDAMPDPGVQRTEYSVWLEKRSGEIVWHGRIKGIDASKRAEIARIAAEFIGRKYEFWDFDLSDERSFYCSKLVWQSVRKATGVALDDSHEPRRLFWVSPKQILKSSHIQLLNNPGKYSRD